MKSIVEYSQLVSAQLIDNVLELVVGGSVSGAKIAIIQLRGTRETLFDIAFLLDGVCTPLYHLLVFLFIFLS